MPRSSLVSHHGVPGWPLAIGAVVLGLSYVWLAVAHRDAALWRQVVHENGQYTLAGTILYFRHFLREIPSAVVMAAFLAATAGASDRASLTTARDRRFLGSTAVLLAVAVVATAVVVVAAEHGMNEVLANLLQFRTRGEESLYGSHWRYHLLHLVWFGAVCTVLAGPRPTPRPARISAWLAAWGLILVGSVAFGISAAVFANTRYVAHQVREILTHGLVTLPVGWWIASRLSTAAVPVRFSLTDWSSRAALAATALIPGALAAVALSGDLRAEAQLGSGYSGLVAAHFFEHTLDYVFVWALVCSIATWRSRRR